MKPAGLNFDGAGTSVSPDWLDTETAGAEISELVSGLQPRSYHWRMRFLYDPTTTPRQHASRWFTVPWNGWHEADLRLSPFIGGFAWQDLDGDGLRDTGHGETEPLLAGVRVDLQNSLGVLVNLTVTDLAGRYRFEIGDTTATYRAIFSVPANYLLTQPDQGTDDIFDSDADPVTRRTALIGPLFIDDDEMRWSAGLRQQGLCIPPDEPIFISGVRPIAGTSYVVLDYQDPNQPTQVTGYNVYRSSSPGLPPSLWPLLGDDVVDEDEATPNKQWVDQTGANPPVGGAWYYEITAYNSACNAEGPR